MNIGIWYYQQCTEVNVYIVGFIYSLYKNTGIDFVFLVTGSLDCITIIVLY